MNSLLAIGSSLPPLQARLLANRCFESGQCALGISPAVRDLTGAPGDGHGGDPATEQQRMLNFISHINAECFISLLQILDPKPDNYLARVEYKRFYRQLRQALEVSFSASGPQPVSLPLAT